MRSPLGSYPERGIAFSYGKVNGKRLDVVMTFATGWRIGGPKGRVRVNCDDHSSGRVMGHGLANEGIAITREQFLASFGKRNDSTLSQWLGAAAERIKRIPDDKDELYLVRKTLLECSPFANLNP